MTSTAENTRTRSTPRARTIDAEGLATEAEVADRLRLEPHTLTQWRWKGQGPRFIRFGARRVRYRWSDVDAWLDAQTQQTESA